MIQLHRDYLLFETAEGQIIPCSAEFVAVELIGDAASSLDPELVQQAASAVLHYFKEDLGWTTVSVGEFSKALEQALQALGLRVHPESECESETKSKAEAKGKSTLRSYDLGQLASDGVELAFFPRLREQVRSN